MGRDTSQPLSIEEAKARLRTAATGVEPAAWVRLNPRQAVFLALISGVMFGSDPASRKAVMKALVRLLLE